MCCHRNCYRKCRSKGEPTTAATTTKITQYVSTRDTKTTPTLQYCTSRTVNHGKGKEQTAYCKHRTSMSFSTFGIYLVTPYGKLKFGEDFKGVRMRETKMFVVFWPFCVTRHPSPVKKFRSKVTHPVTPRGILTVAERKIFLAN